MTPYRHLFGPMSNLKHLHVWDCQMIINKIDKLRVKEVRGNLPDLEKKGYKVFYLEINKFVLSRKCIFLKKNLVVKEKVTKKIDLHECDIVDID